MPKTKPELTDAEVFVDKEKDPWAAKPLTLEGTARLIQLFGTVMEDAAKRAAVQGLFTEGGGLQTGFTAFLGVLSQDRLAELLSIVTGQSANWIKKHYSLVKASQAVGQFMAAEDLGAVLKNLRPTAPTIARAVSAGSPEPSTDSSTNTEEQP